MSFIGKQSKKADTGNVNETEVANNQKGQPIPHVFGRVRVAARWITGPLNQFTRSTPGGGKK
jgi:hypothetical protein